MIVIKKIITKMIVLTNICEINQSILSMFKIKNQMNKQKTNQFRKRFESETKKINKNK